MNDDGYIGSFEARHVGPGPDEQAAMLHVLGVDSLDALMAETVPASIRLDRPLNLPEPESEAAYLERLQSIASKNRVLKSHIGMGYYDCITPPVILRNVFENPSWYTPYTPYQAEISQGRLESLMNFQTMIMDLTGMDVANASLLDEATAAAEAMTLLYRLRHRKTKQESAPARFVVHDRVFPQVLELLKTRAEPLGITLDVCDVEGATLGPDVFGVLIQYPDDRGAINDWRDVIARVHEAGAHVVMGADLLSLTLLTPPGEMGADIVYGSAQRFGVPMGYGGPHAAFFAVRDAFKREMPGRVVGLSVDKHGAPAYRLALQAREQHIRREKATSNICTAQALLANMAVMYGIYHGAGGLKKIAERVHAHAARLDEGLRALGFEQVNTAFFDTLCVRGANTDRIRPLALKAGMNLRYIADGAIGIALDETTTAADVDSILSVFAESKGLQPLRLTAHSSSTRMPDSLRRTSDFMTHPVFRSHHSETEMMRYIKRLERKDIGLDTSMIPLGSCTMKLNAAAEMMPVSWAAFNRLHPFVPRDQAEGYRQIVRELETYLCEMTGFDAVSLQPNAGAQGEYAGLLAVRAYHRARGEPHRNVALIPSSAHGTNPASAIMAGMKVVVVACDDDGFVDMGDLVRKAEEHKDSLAVLMVTYPSTFGVFEEQIADICAVVHANGGQVYMDGANMNAQVGLTSPARVGADVCHLNMHKTFAIPHGGGGPGMGPIAVAAHLAPYLPCHPVVDMGLQGGGITAVSAAPWGSASILLISYAYIRLLGAQGVVQATKVAILNANYIKQRLASYFDVHYVGRKNRVAHELIFDLRPFKESAGITEADVAKRLMDYGFHAPTVSWPVPGTMMIEPTESESKEELDRFCDAMIAIHGEIQAIVRGETDREDNVLRNAPHTAEEIASDAWSHPYGREQAAYPLPFVRANKFWPAVGRIDNTYGDRNLVCSCPPVSAYS